MLALGLSIKYAMRKAHRSPLSSIIGQSVEGKQKATSLRSRKEASSLSSVQGRTDVPFFCDLNARHLIEAWSCPPTQQPRPPNSGLAPRAPGLRSILATAQPIACGEAQA